LMIGIELVKDPVTKEKAIEERNEVIQACFKKGLLILGCGENVIRLIPPLIITQGEADLALTILEDVLKEMKV
jgi:4-aminobutyrate aminotransferase